MEGAGGVRVDMKLHKSTYERNARRNRRAGRGSGSDCMGAEWGMRWEVVAGDEAAHPQTTQTPQLQSADGDAPPGVGHPHEPDELVSSSRRTGGGWGLRI